LGGDRGRGGGLAGVPTRGIGLVGLVVARLFAGDGDLLAGEDGNLRGSEFDIDRIAAVGVRGRGLVAAVGLVGEAHDRVRDRVAVDGPHGALNGDAGGGNRLEIERERAFVVGVEVEFADGSLVVLGVVTWP
jgi:hypothetical protein